MRHLSAYLRSVSITGRHEPVSTVYIEIHMDCETRAYHFFYQFVLIELPAYLLSGMCMCLSYSCAYVGETSQGFGFCFQLRLHDKHTQVCSELAAHSGDLRTRMDVMGRSGDSRLGFAKSAERAREFVSVILHFSVIISIRIKDCEIWHISCWGNNGYILAPNEFTASTRSGPTVQAMTNGKTFDRINVSPSPFQTLQPLPPGKSCVSTFEPHLVI